VPWAAQSPEYQVLENASELVDISDRYQELDGFTDVLRSIGRGVSAGAGYVYGAIRSAASIGSAYTQASGDPGTGSRLAAAMAAARTVGEQLSVWNEAIRSLQARMGRQLTAQEYLELERSTWGPNGAPTGYPSDYPALSAAGMPGWVLPAVAVGLFLLFRRGR
jgi:hypothetical protein